MAAGAVRGVPLFFASPSVSTDQTPNLSLRLCSNPPSIRVSRSRFSGAAVVAPRLANRVFRVHGLVGDDSVTAPEPEPDNSEAGAASIDLRLPRRSLLVQFTCDSCGERTKRLVNRLAYERGAIFVQCAGCLRHHKLVDNLGLITEYDFREKMNIDSETDQV